ncbi:MAG TPA: zinc ribbon domain-containing protein [Candidatus Lokiarchaeia archaeon]|nr:zinc ribbon domain-containing protein [Candidatus Lokiarchaeia archaeon]
MLDLGKEWMLLVGPPELKQDWRARDDAQKLANKAFKKCSVCIEVGKVVVADEKGKNVHVEFELPTITGVEVRKITYRAYSAAQGGGVPTTQAFAVVLLEEGKIFSFLNTRDATGIRLDQLTKALQPSAQNSPKGSWLCGTCGSENPSSSKFCGECGTSRIN